MAARVTKRKKAAGEERDEDFRFHHVDFIRVYLSDSKLTCSPAAASLAVTLEGAWRENINDM